MCFATKQPKADARHYQPPTNDIRGQEFLIAQRMAFQAVQEWRKQKLLKKLKEQRKAAFKARMVNLIDNVFMNMDTTNFEELIGRFNAVVEEMVILECVHLAFMNLN